MERQKNNKDKIPHSIKKPGHHHQKLWLSKVCEKARLVKIQANKKLM